MKNYNELKYWIALKNVKGIGEKRFLELIEKYKSCELILNEILNPENLNELLEHAEKELENCEKNNVSIVTILDDEYPEELKFIPAPPPFFYCKGNIDLLKKSDKVAIVGTRNPSEYGRKITEILVKELVEFDILIVSGLARGIDSIAHRVCLKNNGYTIAVIGNGIDIVYPAENRNLYKRISESGLIVSEFPFGTKPEASNFPKRNRIISGISRGVVVVEAGKKSGSIITAMHAIDQGKDVFAFPGSVFSYKSIGTHYLIKNGAYLIENARDLLEQLFPEKFSIADKIVSKEKSDVEFENDLEKRIYFSIKEQPVTIDELVVKFNINYNEIFSIVTQLQLKGLIFEQPGKVFVAI